MALRGLGIATGSSGGGGGGAVDSVFGRTGAVMATSGDYNSDLVTEGSTNLYYTTARSNLNLKVASNLSDLNSAATARTNLGGTTVGSNVFTLTNPSAITFLRVNADNTVDALTAANFRTAIGAGTGNGDALTTNPLSQFAATTSLQLKGVISDETGSGSLVFGTSPTLTTAVITAKSAEFSILETSDNTKILQFAPNTSQTTGTTVTMTFPNSSQNIVGASNTQTLTNKSFQDNTFFIVDSGDTTKKIAFEASGISTGTTRTLTVPNANVTINDAAALTGNLPVTNLNSGTSASSTTFWRGDGTWATPAGGSSSDSYNSYSADTTLGAGDNGKIIKVNTSGGQRTLTLPAAASNSGYWFIAIKDTADNNNLVLDPNAAELINKESQFYVENYEQAVFCSCDGTEWRIKALFNQDLVNGINVISSNTTITKAYGTIVLDTASVAITLYALAGLTNKTHTFVNLSTGTCTIVRASTDTITDTSNTAVTTYTIYPGQSLIIKAARTTWNVISNSPFSFDSTNNSAGLGLRSPSGLIHVHTTATSNQSMIHLTSATTGSASTDGALIGFPFASGQLIFKDQENAGFGFNQNSVYRLSITTASNSMMAPDGSTEYVVQNTNFIWSPSGSQKMMLDTTGLNVGNNASPGGRLSVAAGSATIAPVKLTSGTILTTPVAGVVEYDGTFALTKVSAIRYRPIGVLTQDYTDAGNTTTTETDLYSYTIPASTLDTNGHKIAAEYGGIFVNSTSTKQLKVYFGGTAVFDSGALTITASSAWSVYVLCVRVSSSVVRCSVGMNTSGASLAGYASYTEVTGLTLTNTQVLKITGTAAGAGAATNDIVAKESCIEFKPNN